jgi:dTDP-4-amino-4,6-dideoxygalactose transaminase
MASPTDEPWYYEQILLGFNYRMTDLQAALGASQLDRLTEFVDRRARLARRYSEKLAGLPLELPVTHSETKSSWHLYAMRLAEGAKLSRRELFLDLRRANIGVNVHYRPVYLQPWYRKLGFRPGLCPQAERYYARAITLPLHPAISESQQDYIVARIEEALG